MARPHNPGICRAAEIHRAKTHCPKGHAYTPENTYRTGNERGCRTCRRLAVQRFERKRAIQHIAACF